MVRCGCKLGVSRWAFWVGGCLSVCFLLFGWCCFTLGFLREGGGCVLFAKARLVEGMRGADFLRRLAIAW